MVDDAWFTAERLRNMSLDSRLAEGALNRAAGADRFRRSPPPWLDDARKAARRVRHSPEGGPYCVYVILLYDHRPPEGRWGLYVGQTFRTAQERFEQHVSGHRLASKVVTRFGVRLLPRFTRHLEALGQLDSKTLETQVYDALRALDIWVEGGR